MNQTIRKFGYPGTLIREYDHWVVLLRPQQATLGALVLACKDPVTRFGDASSEAFAQLQTATREVEAALAACFSYQKINYLMLMMVDPDVHFHVLPRYGEPKRFADISFTDAGWPGPPRLDAATETDEATNGAIAAAIKDAWPQ